MVNLIRRALKGFLLLPGHRTAMPDQPHFPESIAYRASAIRGFFNKDCRTRFLMLTGREEVEVLRHLRAIVVQEERPPKGARYEEGLNLVIFRGVFGSGGYGLTVRAVRWERRRLVVDCDFEDPGQGIRTMPGFTQPAAIIPLKRLPPGKYHARLHVRALRRSATGIEETEPRREVARHSFRVFN
jgi:hypothetical protein